MVATTATTTPFDAKDVNDQVNKTISQDGLLMRMAKAKGEQYAAGRGLSNSSIGAEASQRAIVDAALPIASQNAGQAQQTALTNLQFKNQTALNNQQNQATTARDETLFGYDQKNKATDFSNSLKTMSEQQKYDLQKLNAQTQASKDLAAQQQQYTLTNTAKQVAANTQGMYLDAINGLTSTFGDQVAAIQASAMKAADKTVAINSLINSQNAMLKFYQSTYQNMSTIKDDWINVDVMTLPSGTIANVK